MATPLTVVIFGASGDLTSRKLVPALFNLARRGRLPAEARIVGVARTAFSDDAFREFLVRQADHFYLTFLDTRPYTIDSWSDAVDELNFVLQEYDFIGVTERLDESLVVLMLLLRLPMADVLYYTSKVHA